MKKKLLFLFVSAFASSSNVFAQTSVSATWSLQTNSTVSITGAGATDITASSQILGAGITSVTYGNSYDVDNTPTNDNWQKMGVKSAESDFAAAVSSNFYTEYKVTPGAGKYYQLNTVSINVVGSGGSTNRLVALYSLDGFATSSPLANPIATYKTEGDPLTPTLYRATETDPVPLINVGNTSSADLEGREVLTFSNLQINVNPLQTLSIRFYYFQTGTGNRFASNKNIIFTGKSDVIPLPLPLNFLSLKASSNSLNKEIKLDWSTDNEINTQKFIIESAKKGNFEPIGEVKSFNTSGVHYYTFTDWNPAKEVSYYRLKQVDNDGAFTYSDVVFANNKNKVSISSYPNPAVSEIFISHPVSSNGIIYVIGTNGVKVNSQKVKEGSTITSMNVSHLQPGFFTLVFENRDSRSTFKFVKE